MAWRGRRWRGYRRLLRGFVRLVELGGWGRGCRGLGMWRMSREEDGIWDVVVEDGGEETMRRSVLVRTSTLNFV